MKRIFTILCALALVMAGSATALAAEPAEGGQSASYYPISVEEYTYGDFDELRINKTYQLSLSDDSSLIPTGDFTRNGRHYYLLDMTRKDEVGVDIQTHTETITQASDTNSLEAILQRLDAEMEVTTEDGYVGVLRLDHTSVQVTTDGYATKTSTLTASRSYPNLSEADVSLMLANRFARLARGWEASTPGKRQEDLEKILAARNVAAKLPDLITESDALALLNLEDPLQAVAEQWLKMTGLDRPQDDALRQCVGTLCGSALRQDARQTAKTQKAHRRDTMVR